MTGEKLVVLAGGISSRMKKPAEKEEHIDGRLLNESDEKTKSMIGVGRDYRPFLDYLLYNARCSGHTDILIVVGEKDESIRKYYGGQDKNNKVFGLNISYAIQKIPEGFSKPIGTADALYQGLVSVPEWSGCSFTVCNSDNLYSIKALETVLNSSYMNMLIDYDRSALEFETDRIARFAVTKKNEKGFLLDIIEKPSIEEIHMVKGKDGFIGVSMNIFRLQYDMIMPLLEKVPFHPVRNEKELPEAVKMMANEVPESVYAYPMAVHVPDLTNKNDIIPVQKYLEKHYPDFAL